MAESTRLRAITTSPAPRPERGAEGKDLAQLTDAIASVFDAAGRHSHLARPIYTHGRRPELPPPPGAKAATGDGGEQRERRREPRTFESPLSPPLCTVAMDRREMNDCVVTCLKKNQNLHFLVSENSLKNLHIDNIEIYLCANFQSKIV